jgi:uncharacterized protein with HEPN domain
MLDEDRVRLQHMVDAAEAAAQFVAGRRRTDLDTDRMLLFALVRSIEIIGEAASKVTEQTRSVTPELPWKAIVGMRNRLIHAYFDIDADILWVAATVEVPDLHKRLRVLLDEPPCDGG